jgi:cell division protein FtsI/penicillin-binding protein 2
MRAMLMNVVKEGTATRGKVKGYQVCGKTGTAQKARTDGKPGYAPGKYVSSFTGFLPAGDPQVLILITLDEPTKAIYGGTVAGPMFSKLAAYCVEHLKIPPGDRITAPSQSDGG